MGRLQNKVAVITGGASGMGRATVLRFLAEGARVVIADYNAATGEDTLAEASRAGHADRARFIRTDVAKEADIEAMIRCATDTFGRLDIVFNNAGVGGAIGPLTETSVADWDYTFDVLAKGVFLGIKHAARVMRAQGRGGSIINTASIAGLSGDGGPLVYSAAKAAVISLSQSAAVELAGDRIRVNAICPGFIVTPLAQGANREGTRGRVCKIAAVARLRARRTHRGRRALSRERRCRVRDRRSADRRWRLDGRGAGVVEEIRARVGAHVESLGCHEGQHRRTAGTAASVDDAIA